MTLHTRLKLKLVLKMLLWNDAWVYYLEEAYKFKKTHFGITLGKIRNTIFLCFTKKFSGKI